MQRDEMMNGHVIVYYRFLCRLAELRRRHMAQLHYYTLAMKEQDPGWKAGI